MRVRLLVCVLLCWGCSDPPPQQASAPETEAETVEEVVVTRWTDSTELFMEHPALRVGAASRFAIHLTDLASFEPLREGRVVVSLDYGGGRVDEFATDHPSRPGIFGVDVIPSRSGLPAMAIRVESSSIEDVHDLGPSPVRDPQAAADSSDIGTEAEPEGGGISYLKEQQWILEFATQLVAMQSMRESILVPATIEPHSGGRMVVTAPVSGRLLPSVRLPALGALVEYGAEIGVVVPLWSGPPDRTSLQLAIDEATVAVESATRDRERLERLLAVGAVPARRVHEAKARETVAEANKRAAEDRMAYFETTRRDAPHEDSRNSFSIRSHLAGVVTALHVTNGAHVEEGDVLLEVAAVDSVHASAAVPESQSNVLRKITGAEIQLPGSETALPVQKLVSVARVVDPATRTLKATYLVDNRRHQLSIGQSLFLRLFTSDSVDAPTVPTSAVIEESGRTLAYVQVGGESFEDRSVTVGNRQGAHVQIAAGLQEGERVVTRGAYLVRLASMSTQAPAHGHVH